MVCCGLAWGTHRCWVPTELSAAGITRAHEGPRCWTGSVPLTLSPSLVLSSAKWEPRRYRASPWHPPRAPCPRWPHGVPGAEAVSRGAPCHPGRSRDYRRCATCWPCTFLPRASGTGTNFSCTVPWRGQGPDVALGIAAPQDLSGSCPASSFLDVLCSSKVTCVLWSRGVRKGFPWGVLPRRSVNCAYLAVAALGSSGPHLCTHQCGGRARPKSPGAPNCLVCLG